MSFQRNFTRAPGGSVLARCGRTTVLCTASIEQEVPPFLTGSGKGWVTAEYQMLPGSTAPRKAPSRSGPDGRSTEIRRLIGRVLRGVTRLDLLGERTVYLDCHVLEADGGTRTTAINGSYVAMADALTRLGKRLKLDGWWPMRAGVAGVSVGVVNGECVLDLDYSEDSSAAADVNVAVSHAGEFVEIQATGEQRPVAQEEMEELLDLARRGGAAMAAMQKEALAAGGPGG